MVGYDEIYHLVSKIDKGLNSGLLSFATWTTTSVIFKQWTSLISIKNNII